MSAVGISVDDLDEITQEVWLSYLDPEQGSPLVPAPANGASEVSAAVSITGAWQGHVVFECSSAASRRVAAALMGVESGAVTAEDVADALGELVNIIGGSVKSLLPGPCVLSLPYMLVAPQAPSEGPVLRELCRLSASWLDEPISISVLERPDRDDGATSA